MQHVMSKESNPGRRLSNKQCRNNWIGTGSVAQKANPAPAEPAFHMGTSSSPNSISEQTVYNLGEQGRRAQVLGSRHLKEAPDS